METENIRLEDLPHYTHHDYNQWEGRWELIRGIPFAMSPQPVLEHQRICGKIYSRLDSLLTNCGQCEVMLPVDWQVAEDTVVQPDLLVVCGTPDEIGTAKLEKTPVLVFEVISPSTASKDRGVKYDIYEKAGVKYYCIVDPKIKSAEIYVMQKDRYRNGEEFHNGKMRFDLGECEIQLDWNEIFAT